SIAVRPDTTSSTPLSRISCGVENTLLTMTNDSPIGFRVYKDGEGRVKPSTRETAEYLPSPLEQH
ncbi:hypothetical protein AVEN_104487-1, partial [Araneus ventricosus]